MLKHFALVAILWLCAVPAARAGDAASGAECSLPPVFLYAERVAANHPELAKTLTADPGELAPRISGKLTVILDFFEPNLSGQPDATWFGPESGRKNVWPWSDILRVDPLSGPQHANGAHKCFQVRARVAGPAELLPAELTFPVRIYRSFMNEVDDGEPEFESAYKALFGKAEKGRTGCVLEPRGRIVELKRVEGVQNPAVFISEVIDLDKEPALNPERGLQPPSVAAFDADAYFTQYRETRGDEEADACAFLRAMTAAGFVSAGLAHPRPDKFSGGMEYQLALGLCDKELFDIPAELVKGDLVTDPAARGKLRGLEAALRAGALKPRLKNLGASKVLGRPLTNGAFIVSTGVQKLVVTAAARADNGDSSWRMPGLVRVLDGWMDQCLVRAPASVFLFSGHGWDGLGVEMLNCYTKDNPAICRARRDFEVEMFPAMTRWTQANALPENTIDLSQKWLKGEVRLQWVFLLGCYALRSRGAPFSPYASSGKFGRLLIRDLGARGVLGFAEHGFSSASFMRRLVKRAGEGGVAAAWLEVWHDQDAKAYQWYEENEKNGVSWKKTFDNALSRIVPAYLVRAENAGDPLTPAGLAKPLGGEALEYGEYSENDGGLRKTKGTFAR